MLQKLFVIIVLLLFLCGCTKGSIEDQPKEYEYSSQEVTYSEENGQYSFRTNMDFTETVLTKYYFDPEIKTADRQSCIEATELILSYQQNHDAVPEIYVFTENRYSSKYITEGKLFTTSQDWQSTEYTTDVLLAVYGEFSHYGLTYGYANWLCGELQWECSIAGQFVQPDVLDVCDLNLLCFDTAFVSDQDAKAAEQVACDFVKSYADTYSGEKLQQLLADSDTAAGMESLKVALFSYYQDKSLSYEPSLIRYGYGGASFDYIVSSDLGTFYLVNGWTDINKDYNPLVSDNFLHENYIDVKNFYEINLQQMQQYQNLFALDNYNNDLSIVFSNSKNLSQYSFYQSGTHRIYVMNVDSLMHEYIHALTQPKTSMNDWETEGFARYFSYWYDYYGIAFLNQDYNNTPESAATLYVHEYLDTIDRPIDMAIDYAEIENIGVYSRRYKNPNASYVAGSSFVQYLVSQYGESAVIQSIYGQGEPLPKEYSELVIEWNEFIEGNYQSYSRYTK